MVDSLNMRAYHFRYIDIDSTRQLAQQALTLAGHYVDGRDEALQNLAFVEYQQMNFDGVDSILHIVRNESYNQLLLLCADVLEMKTTQRTDNGERFFKAKTQAEKRMARIAEEDGELTERDSALWVYAQTEFHIISSTYYLYQEQDSLAQAEMDRVLPCLDICVDTAQWIYYNYMLGPGRLVEGESADEITLQEFDYLFTAYKLSHRLQMRYFEANSLQAFAYILLWHEKLVAERRPDEYHMLYSRHLSGLGAEEGDLPLALCKHALLLFQAYNDLFQTACTYRTLGEVYFERGAYDLALVSYAQALHCVNVHHLRYYGDLSPDTLMAFNPEALERSVEKEWMENPRISTVPEWIAGIRQQFSLTYSALDMKQASDYNRNFYLDLLQATNQNQELEGRTMELKRQTKALYGRMVLSLLMFVVMLVLFFLFRLRLKRQASASIRDIQDALELLRIEEPSAHFASLQQSRFQPYHRFLKWNMEQLSALQDDLEEAKECLAISAQHVTENKRKNAENRAKVALVHAIVPFLDRIGGEVIRMERDGKVTEERKEYISELAEQIEIYNDILTEWIKMEQGQLNLHVSTVSLNQLFSIVAEGHFPFDQKGISLCVESTDLFVKADESLTLFMINTLADNARKFTPAGGSVTLSAKAEDDYVEVMITDTGCGLTAEDVNILNTSKVYDASEIGQSKEAKGFGFGLMNCRGIIEKYKKTSALFASCAFGVRSQIGQGSTFFFRLPRVVRLLLLLLSFSGICQANGWETYYDSAYQANVEGRYADAIRSAQQALEILNQQHPSLPALCLLETDGGAQMDSSELLWAQTKVDVDYALIVALRNEVALAALALHDWPLYQYNNRVCTRLHKFIHQDQTLPTYYHRLEQTHQSSNLLLVFILISAVVILILSYKLLVGRQVKIERGIDELSRYCLHLLAVAQETSFVESFYEQTSEWPTMRDWAVKYQQAVANRSVYPQNILREEIACVHDEQTKMEFEERRLYVQNQVLDNCLSTIKHESMYYPSRIRLLSDGMTDGDIAQLAELVHYYQHIYTLLCRQADVQVAQPGFKRQHISVHDAFQRAEEILKKVVKRQRLSATCRFENCIPTKVVILGDEILLDMLFESLFTGMLPRGEQFEVQCEDDGRFVRFTIRDCSTHLLNEKLETLFYPESHNISYLVAKQILREHDTYANHPGCRLNAVAQGEGYEIYFTLLKVGA